MQTKRSGIILKIVGYIFCVVALLLIRTAPSEAQDVIVSPLSMTPFKIVLNAQGKSDDFQGILNMTIGSGYRLSSFEVHLLLNGFHVAQAESFRYCYVDDNFLAGFDRQEVLTSPVVQGLANTEAEATVQGWYVAVASDGTYETRFFTGSDLVEIVDPEKR